MQNAKALSARVILQDQDSCNDVFSQLLAEIEAMPADVRGVKALSMSAKLLEWAAFEMAGDLSSEEIGTLIHRSADLVQQSTDVAERKLTGFVQRSPVLQ